ncbi:MAG: Gfo/Idh/MocA family oxidoreductase [Cytophagales bacterium]|nr:Gfo/Idh/MocA family oxidoreductase [Cytophagales bacterium]
MGIGKSLGNRYRRYRKSRHLSAAFSQKYAFLGIGQHSLSNLYPCLHYLGVPLKYICTQHESEAMQMAARFVGCRGTARLLDILEDEEVGGVFVSAQPEAHMALASQILSSGKGLFIEKPPCNTVSELDELIVLQQGPCVVGLQKRYSHINSLLTRRIKDLGLVKTYRAVYGTGSYPEGDVLRDLFIHAIDNILFLFGEIIRFSVELHDQGYILCSRHKEGVVGSLELSTGYTWKSPVDSLILNTPQETYEIDYPYSMMGTVKPISVGGIPWEKILNKPLSQKIYYQNTAKLPIDKENSLSIQGYLPEVQTFLSLVEGSGTKNLSSLSDIRMTYEFMEKLRDCVVG